MNVTPAAPGSHREALIEGAIRCLQTLGYARTTARAVVEASGTNLGSIAYHFGSIENLRDEALVEASERWLGPMVAAARARVPTGARLEDFAGVFVASLSAQRPLVVGFFEALAQIDRKESLRRRLAAAYDELRAALAAIGEQRGLPPTLVIALFDGLMVQWLIDPATVAESGRLVGELSAALG